MKMFYIYIIIYLFLCPFCDLTPLESVLQYFGEEDCVMGLVSTIPVESSSAYFIKESEATETQHSYVNDTIIKEDNDKSSLSQVHELAQYNKIKYVYQLEKEEGLSHEKKFTISLTLGDEKYLGVGPSIKTAQQKAASLALELTEYQTKPPLVNEEKNVETPTVLLNNLAAKLGLPVEYFLEEKDLLYLRNSNLQEKPSKTYLQKLNESLNFEENIRKEESQIKGPFTIKVQVGDLEFYGKSRTVQNARHKAASEALNYFLKKIEDEGIDCLTNKFDENCIKAKESIKSSISLVYEAAQARNMDVYFEIIEESGPDHKKTFVTKCSIGELSATGEGPTKKKSKKVAAQNMLEQISQLPPISENKKVKQLVSQKNNKSKKKKKILKSTVDQIKFTVENFVDKIMDFGKETFIDNNEIKSTDSKKIKSLKAKGRHFEGKILELSNKLNFEIFFTDNIEEDNHYSIMSLHLTPEYMCLGEGKSKTTARNQAAMGGLKLLLNVGFYDKSKGKTYTLEELGVKEQVESILLEVSSENEL